MKTVIHQADGSTQTYNAGKQVNSTIPSSAIPNKSPSAPQGKTSVVQGTTNRVNSDGSVSMSPSTTAYRAGTTSQFTPASTTKISAESNLDSKPQWQQMLDQIQGGDKQTFLSALASAQQKWGEYNANGDTEKANAAHTWANQLRDAAGLSGQYDQTTGQMTDQGQSLYNSFQQAQTAQPTAQAQQQPQPQQTNPYLQMYLQQYQAQQDLMNKINNPDSDVYSTIKKTAQEQAHQQAQAQLSQFQTLMSQLRSAENRGLSGVDNNTADASQALDDKSFQQYLDGRQDMANRGLAGSGLASDQDTRLLMAKQRDLAGLYRDAATSKQSVRDQYENQIADTQRQMSLVNEQAMYNQLYSSLYGTTKQSMLDGAKTQFQGLDGLRQMLDDTMKNDTTVRGQDVNLLQEQMKGQNNLDVEGLKQQYNLAIKQGDWANAQIIQGMIGDVSTNNNIRTNQTSLTNNQLNNSTKSQIAQLQATVSRQNNLDNNATELTKSENTMKGLIEKIKADKSNANMTALGTQAERLLAMASQTKDVANKSKDKQEQQSLLSQWKDYMTQVGNLVNQANGMANQGSQTPSDQVLNFSNLGEGGDGNYNNYHKMGSEAKANPQAYSNAASAIKTALEKEGAPSNWLTPMLELSARESSFDPTNQNNTSSAYGLFQFLNGTWGNTGISKTDDPVQQAQAAIRYIKNRPNYGDPYKALQFWDANNWY